jgi:putative transposase
MLTYCALFSISMMARVLLVSRSGYYSWLDSREVLSWRMQQREAIDALVRAAFVAGKGRNGSERIFYDLAEQDNPLDIKTINKSLKRQGLIAKAAKLFKVTTDSNHALPVAPNLLERNFSARQPNEKWVTDITYIQTTEGWLYLAVMMDLYSRKIVGWSMGKNIDAQLVCDALMMALWRRKFPQGVIVHSDRGSQYASHAFRDLLKKYSLKQSMSRKGDCWDNACAESFFHSLKVELIHGEPLQNGKQTRESIFEYIEVDYNRYRRHSAIGFISPERFEATNVC